MGRIQAAKRLMHQYWKYGESVSRSLAASKRTEAGSNAVSWIPVWAPQDLVFLEEIVGRLDGRLGELAELAETIKKMLDSLQSQQPQHTPEGINLCICINYDVSYSPQEYPSYAARHSPGIGFTLCYRAL